MAQKLDANLRVIQNAPIEIALIDGNLHIIAQLDDEPNDVGGLTAAELKAKFDEAGVAIQTYINETLIPAILAADATEIAREDAETERVENETERVANEQSREKAEVEREKTIAKVENMTATAESITSDSPATAEVTTDPDTGALVMRFGIPAGRDGRGTGDMEVKDYDPNGVKAPVAFRPVYEADTMLASGWSGNTYSFESAYPKNAYNISIEVAPAATAEQFEAFGGAMICGSADSNVATALGDVPTVDIPIIIKVVRK